MKVGQHHYSTLDYGQEPFELSMVFNPDPSRLSITIQIYTMNQNMIKMTRPLHELQKAPNGLTYGRTLLQTEITMFLCEH